jgi:ubiquinone/menaquinone biosynthesis C-methylase UbiE
VFADPKSAFADFPCVFTECAFDALSRKRRIKADQEVLMSAYVSTTKPYKGRGMEGVVAKWYANLTKKSLNDFRALARRTAEQIPPEAHVLEVAPGPGYLAIELAKLGDYQITGLDISRTFVEIARANAAKAGVCVDFRQGSASNMPFAEESFDFLFCRAAFKNFSEPTRALEEMYRVLRPGGKALIIDLRRDASRESIRQAVNGMNLGTVNAMITELTFRFMLLKRAYTKSEFEQLISRTGFHDVEIQENPIALEIFLSKASPDFLSWAYFTLHGASLQGSEQQSEITGDLSERTR